MIKTLTDTIHKTVTIIDTVNTSSASSLDLISKVDSFYNNAWTKLIWIIGVFFTVIALITPAVTLFFQKRELKLDKERLEKDIQRSETDLKSEVDFKVKEATDAIELKFQKEIVDMKIMIDKYSANLESIIKTQLNKTMNRDLVFLPVTLERILHLAKNSQFKEAVQMTQTVFQQLHGMNVQSIDAFLANDKKSFTDLIKEIQSISNNTDLNGLLDHILGNYREFHSPGTYGINDMGGYDNVYKEEKGS